MAKKAVKRIVRPRKGRRQKAEPNFLERLKKLSDSAPTAKLRGGRFDFDEDLKTIRFKDE